MSRQRPTANLNRPRSRSFWPLLGMLALIVSPTSQAATYTVNSSGDAPLGSDNCSSTCTLRAAIQAANANPGADIINLGTLDVQLTLSGRDENSAVTGDLDISGDLTIIGQNGSRRNIINANGVDRVFHILSGAEVTMQNISVRGGSTNDSAGAGIYLQSGKLNLSSVEIRSNTLNLTKLEATFETSGGGLHVGQEGIAIIESTDIVQNKAPAGGGITNLGRTELRKSLIDGNTSTGGNSNGGGINNLGGYLTLGSSTISNNRSANLGGGIYHANLGENFGNIIITNSVIFGNQSTFSGPGFANLGPATISNSTISNNINTFRGDGGGIYNSAIANLDIINSTISSNSARSGGAIFNTRDITITNSTIYNNTSSPDAGASVDSNGAIGGNQVAMFSSGGLADPNIIFTNTIIANGPDSNPNEKPCAGSTGYATKIESLGHNLENANTCGLANSPQLNDIINAPDVGLDAILAADPTIAAQTKYTTPVHALLAGSPAINTGSTTACPIVDQRFMIRDQACDIGAYEYGADQFQGVGLVDLKATISDSPDPIIPYDPDKQQPLTYVVTVTNLYVDTAADEVTVAISLPKSYLFANNNSVSTSTPANCEKPNSENVITCTVKSIPGLGRVEFFITGYPTQIGTITATVNVFSATQDAFAQNNTNIRESTVVSLDADDTINFGGSKGGGGGGVLHPLMLLLGLLLARRLAK